MAKNFCWSRIFSAVTLLVTTIGCSADPRLADEAEEIASTEQSLCDSNAQAVCQSFCINTCTDGATIAACMNVCMGNACSPYKADSSGRLAQALSSGSFEVSDVRWLPNATNGVVSFGFGASPKYGLPADFGGRCPSGAVQLSTPGFAGGANICVETSPTANDPWLQSRATSVFSNIVANPGSANTGLPGLRDAMDTVLQGFLTGMVCRTDENADIAFCLRREGHVDFRRPLRLGGLCPVPPDTAFQNACVNRGSQTPLGCGVIACVEPLASLGVVGCTAAVNGGSLSPAKLLASGAFCALIDKRDHFYTAPRFGGSVELCSTTNPRCTRDFVVNLLKADIRRQAPFVLNGPPVGGRPADPLLVPRPVFPNTFYYLGPHLDLLGILNVSTGTSNPITVELPTGSFVAAVNVADPDHLLVGKAESRIFQEGTSIRSQVVGYGSNTRFALLNELIGPTALGKAQKELRSAVQSAL